MTLITLYNNMYCGKMLREIFNEIFKPNAIWGKYNFVEVNVKKLSLFYPELVDIL